MKIQRLTKVKLGDAYPIVEVIYINMLGFKKKRHAYKRFNLWYWVDNGTFVLNDVIMDEFYNSSEYMYEINK